MPSPSVSLLTVTLQLRNNSNQSEAERLRELADVGLSYLANLEHLTSISLKKPSPRCLSSVNFRAVSPKPLTTQWTTSANC